MMGDGGIQNSVTSYSSLNNVLGLGVTSVTILITNVRPQLFGFSAFWGDGFGCRWKHNPRRRFVEMEPNYWKNTRAITMTLNLNNYQ
jgi:hypothetical protein